METAVFILSAVLAVGAAIVACALVAALLTPVKLDVDAGDRRDAWLEIVARPFGGWAPPIRLYPGRKTAQRAPRKERRAARSRSARRRRIRFGDALSAAPELIGDLARAVRVERLSVDAEIGLGDPADTGQLFGVVAAARYALPSSSRISIDLRPDFVAPRVSGDARARLSVTPLAVLAPMGRFAWRVFGPRR